MNFEKLDYLINKRLVILKRANTPLQRRLQILNNQTVDKYVLGLESNDEYSFNWESAKVSAEIFGANQLATDKLIRQYLRKSIATDDQINRLLAKNAAQKVNKRLTTIEVERIQKNLKYVEATLNQAELDVNLYKEIINKLPRTVSRQDILEKALRTGENYKGREYTYKELGQLSRDLEKYKDNALQYETAKIENTSAQRDGFSSINRTKVWVWSTLEKTRHEGMEGQTVDLYEKFEVTNEVTGATDYLRFPGDIDNDHNNCSNICNCQCSYIILPNEE